MHLIRHFYRYSRKVKVSGWGGGWGTELVFTDFFYIFAPFFMLERAVVDFRKFDVSGRGISNYFMELFPSLSDLTCIRFLTLNDMYM